eukprot:1158223-Pelagomonas_calceolata.AAC.3
MEGSFCHLSTSMLVCSNAQKKHHTGQHAAQMESGLRDHCCLNVATLVSSSVQERWKRCSRLARTDRLLTVVPTSQAQPACLRKGPAFHPDAHTLSCFQG